MKKQKIKSLYFIAAVFGAMCFKHELKGQTSERPWAIGLDVNYKEYNGEFGKSFFRFRHPNLQPGIGVYRYLNSWFDAGVTFNYGSFRADDYSTVLPSELTYKGLYSNLVLRVKMNNGSVLKEDVRVAPYLLGGLGYHLGKKHVPDALNSSFVSNTLLLTMGAGLKVNLNDRLGLIVQSAWLPSVTDKLDGHVTGKRNDQWWEHKIGIAYHFGGSNRSSGSSSADQDGDGVEDAFDRCQNTRKGAKVDRFGCEIVDEAANSEIAKLVKGINFATNSAQIKNESLTKLDRLAEILLKFPAAKLIIEGHTDNTGDYSLNLTLSEKRAEAVKSYLVSRGINADKMVAKGYGSSMPVASNNTEEGRALNRRVEIILTK